MWRLLLAVSIGWVAACGAPTREARPYADGPGFTLIDPAERKRDRLNPATESEDIPLEPPAIDRADGIDPNRGRPHAFDRCLVPGAPVALGDGYLLASEGTEGLVVAWSGGALQRALLVDWALTRAPVTREIASLAPGPTPDVVFARTVPSELGEHLVQLDVLPARGLLQPRREHDISGDLAAVCETGVADSALAAVPHRGLAYLEDELGPLLVGTCPRTTSAGDIQLWHARFGDDGEPLAPTTYATTPIVPPHDEGEYVVRTLSAVSSAGPLLALATSRSARVGLRSGYVLQLVSEDDILVRHRYERDAPNAIVPISERCWFGLFWVEGGTTRVADRSHRPGPSSAADTGASTCAPGEACAGPAGISGVKCIARSLRDAGDTAQSPTGLVEVRLTRSYARRVCSSD